MKKTITVIICALNEEKNIGQLLKDISDQKFDQDFKNNFDLSTITVVSDGSTDKTVEIVQDFQKNDPRVKLIINENRIGKIFSLDKVLKATETDFIILFDADVRLESSTINNLTKPLSSENYDLIGGNPVPILPESRNLAERASIFSWTLLQEIKKHQPHSIYSSHGRVLLASKKLYKSLDIGQLSTPGDDQFMYLKSNQNFYYEKSATVSYAMPSSVEDYLKQNVRFRKAKLTRTNSDYGKDYIKDQFKIENKFSIFFRSFFKNPLNGISWMILYCFGFLRFKLVVEKTSDIQKIWGEVKSTK